MAEAHTAPDGEALTNTKVGYLLRKIDNPSLDTDSYRVSPIMST